MLKTSPEAAAAVTYEEGGGLNHDWAGLTLLYGPIPVDTPSQEHALTAVFSNRQTEG